MTATRTANDAAPAAGTSTYISTPRRSIYTMIAVTAAGTLAIVGVFLLVVLLVVMPLLTSASRFVSHLPGDYAGYYGRVQTQMQQLQQLAGTPPATTRP